MQRTVTRTITVEVLYTDDPEHEDGQRWDELADATDEEIIRLERSMTLRRWFEITEPMTLSDEITVNPR